MNLLKLMPLVWVLAALCASPVAALAAADPPQSASSEIRKQSNGYWLFVDGVRWPSLAGVVYQNTAGDMHVRAYTNSLHSLYYGLDEEVAGGAGHGKRLAQMGFQAIRVYELPAENADDANRTKEIFRRLYNQYGIKVLIGDWAGLNDGTDFKDPRALARVHRHIDKLVMTYCEEPWVLGWQLGNENNYHIQGGILGHEIDLDAAGYYTFMDTLAGQVKAQLGRHHLTQFVSLGQGDLTEAEAHLIAGEKNFDAVGINCYREDPSAFDQVISLAANNLKIPVYFSEVGKPASDAASEKQQSDYLRDVCRIAFSHCAGRMRSGVVLGAFVHEATDEAWKKFEHGKEGDAHFGILGKVTETDLRRFFTHNHDFGTLVVPVDDAPDTLIDSAWHCLYGYYPSHEPRDYGYAMAYANRAITLYQGEAAKQQAQLVSFKSPPEVAADPKFWALNDVGTGYFIIGDAWMLQSFDLRGSERPAHLWQRALQLADYGESDPIIPTGKTIVPTNADNCVYLARQIFAELQARYSYAHLLTADGDYRPLQKAIQARFPEMLPPHLALTWKNGAIFTGSFLGAILGLAVLSGYRASRRSVRTKPVLGAGAKLLFVLALIFDLVGLFWFVSWWFSPVRMEYYTVRPTMFWVLSLIGALGIFFYFYIWYVLWNMRRPVPMIASAGLRVAIVTTRVASEPVSALHETFKKMAAVAYPHDSYLMDEENNPEAQMACQQANVIHFSRKGKPHYNEPHGKFQAKTKGGNLNSWLYEFGKQYDIVTFLDPDHAPRPDFLDKVLGYFTNPAVAFVQGPPVYYNRGANWIARGAAEQSYLFYGPIQMGLFGIGACVVNGSHSTFRVNDLFALKGDGYAVHDADDILTSMRIHQLGKHGVYIPDVIAEGLAPDTWEEFSKQQGRWAFSMFHLLFYYYIPGLFQMPWRCKVVYLVLTSFYFRGVLFCGLLLLPFISAATGNPPVNAHIAAFCLRFLPFFLLHYGILVLLGQRFLVPQGSRKGFWFRAGILWVAMWWDHVKALVKALRTRRVKDRVVAAKWKSGPVTPWRAVRPHLILAIAGAGAFAWTWFRTDRSETVWGTLLFLGMIVLSQGFIVFKVTRTAKAPPEVQPEVLETSRLALPATAFSRQP